MTSRLLFDPLFNALSECKFTVFISFFKQTNGNLSRPSHDSEGWNSDSESRGGSKPLGNKQLHSVAKQFGSLGRSVGRRLKRNLMENFTLKHASAAPIRLNNDVQWECPDFILCARLHTEKHHPSLEQVKPRYPSFFI